MISPFSTAKDSLKERALTYRSDAACLASFHVSCSPRCRRYCPAATVGLVDRIQLGNIVRPQHFPSIFCGFAVAGCTSFAVDAVVFTVGPACQDVETMTQLIEAGASGARIDLTVSVAAGDALKETEAGGLLEIILVLLIVELVRFCRCSETVAPVQFALVQ